jgi:hypothetical protein
MDGWSGVAGGYDRPGERESWALNVTIAVGRAATWRGVAPKQRCLERQLEAYVCGDGTSRLRVTGFVAS